MTPSVGGVYENRESAATAESPIPTQQQTKREELSKVTDDRDLGIAMRAFILLAVLLPVVTYGQMPGGIQTITLSLTDDVVQFAAEQIQKDLVLEDGQSASLVGIVLARRQNYICDVNVTDNWQTDRLEVTGGPDCQRQHAARHVAGGISDPEPLSSVLGTDREDIVLDALDAAVCEVGQHDSRRKAFKIDRIRGVTYSRQVTSGTTYRFFSVPLELTACNQHVCDRQNLADCKEHHSNTVKTCDLRVQYSPWADPVYEVYLDDNADNPACLNLRL